MQSVSNYYKDAITEMGRQFDCHLDINDSDGNNYVIEGENILSVSVSYDAQLYKSIMSKCIVEINKSAYPVLPSGVTREIIVDLELHTEDGEEDVVYGTYIVKDVEEQKDSDSVRLTCYDNMLRSMIQYDGIDLYSYIETEDTTYQDDKQYYKHINNEYESLVKGTDYNIGDSISGTVYEKVFESITLKQYLIKLCDFLGYPHTILPNVTFPNYDKVLTYDPYIDENGASLGYTFRDIFDDISEATGRNIVCPDGILEIKGINNTNEVIDEKYFKNINVNFGEKYGPINKLSLARSADSDVISRPRQLDDPDATQTDINGQTSIQENGETELVFKDNQLLNRNDRDEWIDEIYGAILGTQYYLNDYSSPGITYLEALDRYTVSINNETYTCIMLADEINITQGLEENVYSNALDGTTTDYKTSSISDRTAIQTTLIVNKQLGEIRSQVVDTDTFNQLQKQVNENEDTMTEFIGTTYVEDKDGFKFYTNALKDAMDDDGNIVKIKSSLVSINNDGINVSTNQSTISTQVTNDAFVIYDSSLGGDGELAKFDNDGAYLDNLKVDKYFIAGNHRVEKDNGRTSWFYIGG